LKRLVAVFAGIVLGVLTGCSAEAPRIGVVDVIRVVTESNQGKKANAELETLVKAKQAELKEKAEAVEKLKKGVEKEPAATKKAREEELGKAAADYQKLVTASDAELQKRAAALRSMVLEDLKKTLTEIGRQNKFLLVLTAESVPYFEKTIDITDKVIKKYNESTEDK